MVQKESLKALWYIFQKLGHLTCRPNTILRINRNEVIGFIHVIVIYYMSNNLTFELYNIFLRHFQDRCQMTRKKGLQNFMKIA